MEGLLHPVGPEDVGTYWIRRCAALAVVVLLVVGLSTMINSIAGARAVSVEPDPGPRINPVVADQGVVEEEAVPVPSQPPAQNESAKEPLEPEPANTFQRAAMIDQDPAPVSSCDPTDIRVSLDGPGQVTKGEPVMYRIGLTNTSEQDCAVQASGKTFELKIHSGEERIWSSFDCVAGLPPRGAVLAPGRGMDWEMEWRADRSAPQCQSGTDPMHSGAYVVTAEFIGANHAQLEVDFRA